MECEEEDSTPTGQHQRLSVLLYVGHSTSEAAIGATKSSLKSPQKETPSEAEARRQSVKTAVSHMQNLREALTLHVSEALGGKNGQTQQSPAAEGEEEQELAAQRRVFAASGLATLLDIGTVVVELLSPDDASSTSPPADAEREALQRKSRLQLPLFPLLEETFLCLSMLFGLLTTELLPQGGGDGLRLAVHGLPSHSGPLVSGPLFDGWFLRNLFSLALRVAARTLHLLSEKTKRRRSSSSKARSSSSSVSTEEAALAIAALQHVCAACVFAWPVQLLAHHRLQGRRTKAEKSVVEAALEAPVEGCESLPAGTLLAVTVMELVRAHSTLGRADSEIQLWILRALYAFAGCFVGEPANAAPDPKEIRESRAASTWCLKVFPTVASLLVEVVVPHGLSDAPRRKVVSAAALCLRRWFQAALGNPDCREARIGKAELCAMDGNSVRDSPSTAENLERARAGLALVLKEAARSSQGVKKETTEAAPPHAALFSATAGDASSVVGLISEEEFLEEEEETAEEGGQVLQDPRVAALDFVRSSVSKDARRRALKAAAKRLKWLLRKSTAHCTHWQFRLSRLLLAVQFLVCASTGPSPPKRRLPPPPRDASLSASTTTPLSSLEVSTPPPPPSDEDEAWEMCVEVFTEALADEEPLVCALAGAVVSEKRCPPHKQKTPGFRGAAQEEALDFSWTVAAGKFAESLFWKSTPRSHALTCQLLVDASRTGRLPPAELRSALDEGRVFFGEGEALAGVGFLCLMNRRSETDASLVPSLVENVEGSSLSETLAEVCAASERFRETSLPSSFRELEFLAALRRGVGRLRLRRLLRERSLAREDAAPLAALDDTDALLFSLAHKQDPHDDLSGAALSLLKICAVDAAAEDEAAFGNFATLAERKQRALEQLHAPEALQTDALLADLLPPNSAKPTPARAPSEAKARSQGGDFGELFGAALATASSSAKASGEGGTLAAHLTRQVVQACVWSLPGERRVELVQEVLERGFSGARTKQETALETPGAEESLSPCQVLLRCAALRVLATVFAENPTIPQAAAVPPSGCIPEEASAAGDAEMVDRTLLFLFAKNVWIVGRRLEDAAVEGLRNAPFSPADAESPFCLLGGVCRSCRFPFHPAGEEASPEGVSTGRGRALTFVRVYELSLLAAAEAAARAAAAFELASGGRRGEALESHVPRMMLPLYAQLGSASDAVAAAALEVLQAVHDGLDGCAAEREAKKRIPKDSEGASSSPAALVARGCKGGARCLLASRGDLLIDGLVSHSRLWEEEPRSSSFRKANDELLMSAGGDPRVQLREADVGSLLSSVAALAPPSLLPVLSSLITALLQHQQRLALRRQELALRSDGGRCADGETPVWILRVLATHAFLLASQLAKERRAKQEASTTAASPEAALENTAPVALPRRRPLAGRQTREWIPPSGEAEALRALREAALFPCDEDASLDQTEVDDEGRSPPGGEGQGGAVVAERIPWLQQGAFGLLRFQATQILHRVRVLLADPRPTAAAFAHQAALRCLFVLSSRLTELMPRIHETWPALLPSLSAESPERVFVVALGILKLLAATAGSFIKDRSLRRPDAETDAVAPGSALWRIERCVFAFLRRFTSDVVQAFARRLRKNPPSSERDARGRSEQYKVETAVLSCLAFLARVSPSLFEAPTALDAALFCCLRCLHLEMPKVLREPLFTAIVALHAVHPGRVSAKCGAAAFVAEFLQDSQSSRGGQGYCLPSRVNKALNVLSHSSRNAPRFPSKLGRSRRREGDDSPEVQWKQVCLVLDIEALQAVQCRMKERREAAVSVPRDAVKKCISDVATVQLLLWNASTRETQL